MLTFMWDLKDAEFQKLVEIQKAGENDDYDNEVREYLGACFVGNFKFELMVNSTGFYYADTLVKEPCRGNRAPFCEVLDDGTPYYLDESIDVYLPRRRTIGHFMEEFERRVIKMFEREDERYRKLAELPTLPYHWYQGLKYQPTITREVMYE